MIWYGIACVLFAMMLCFLTLMSRMPMVVIATIDVAAMAGLLVVSCLVLGVWSV